MNLTESGIIVCGLIGGCYLQWTLNYLDWIVCDLCGSFWWFVLSCLSCAKEGWHFLTFVRAASCRNRTTFRLPDVRTVMGAFTCLWETWVCFFSDTTRSFVFVEMNLPTFPHRSNGRSMRWLLVSIASSLDILTDHDSLHLVCSLKLFGSEFLRVASFNNNKSKNESYGTTTTTLNNG